MKEVTPVCRQHHPRQHRDGKPPWCASCGLTKDYKIPKSRFGDAAKPIQLTIGSEIEVLGERFVLVKLKKEDGKATKVKFVQPIELLEKS